MIGQTPNAFRRLVLSSALLAAAQPAVAHHASGGVEGQQGAAFTIPTPDVLQPGAIVGSLSLTRGKQRGRSDRELMELARQRAHPHNLKNAYQFSLGLSAGVTERLAVDLELPFVRHTKLREGELHFEDLKPITSVVPLGSVSGPGDMTIKAKYALRKNGSWRLSLIGGLKVPTGSTHRRDMQGERLETEHQPGTGSLDPILGFAIDHRIGAFTLNLGGLRQFSTQGAQRAKLGDITFVGAALGWRLTRLNAHGASTAGVQGNRSTAINAVIEMSGEWEGKDRIEGRSDRNSGGKVLWLTPGVRIVNPGPWSLGVSLGVPVWQRLGANHSDNAVRSSFALSRRF